MRHYYTKNSDEWGTDGRTGEANILLGSIYYLSRRLMEVPVIKEGWICEKNEAKLAYLAKKTAHIT